MLREKERESELFFEVVNGAKRSRKSFLLVEYCDE